MKNWRSKGSSGVFNFPLLLKNDFITYYSISSPVSVDFRIIKEFAFDLDDMPSPFHICPKGTGKLTLTGNTSDLLIISYEGFINQCKRPSTFLDQRKKCDYIVISDRLEILLVEITSATGSVANLLKPILDNRGAVMFPGGKYEKVERQLEQSLQTIMAVPSINNAIVKLHKKTALMAYRVYPSSLHSIVRTGAYSRYLAIESNETQENGAVLSCPQIESFGFEYRRINHRSAFRVV